MSINIQGELDGEKRTTRGETAQLDPCLQLDLMHRERRTDGSTSSSLAVIEGSPCQQDDNYHVSKRRGCSGTELPEDIWCHIHSLMTLRDAARAACVSHAFRCSWECYPNLIFNIQTIVLRDGMDFTSRVDHILKKHSGIGVKTFELDLSSCYKSNAYKYLHRWLQIVVKPGMEKLTLVIPEREGVNFPCQVLSDGNGSSIWYLHLPYCAFRPTVSLGCLRCLTVLHLECVGITGDELGYIFPAVLLWSGWNSRDAPI